jgi:hypothetical protein
MNWLLTYNGQTKSFADWGLSNLHRTRVSQAQDTVSFTCPGPYDAAELFPFGSTVEISFQPDSGNPVKWFYGRVIQVPRSGPGVEENMDYVAAGPWWFLDNLVYQQVWNSGSREQPYELQDNEVKLGEETVYDEETGEDVTYDIIGFYKSRVILGQKQDGTRQNSGEVITDVINYAIAAGAPIALGTIEPDLDVPYDEQNDITCAEAIRRMLRWSPDAVTWFDYSTEPYPTFHCARRAELQSLSIGISDEVISNLSIIPRPDIQVPAVVLKFEQTNTVNGVDYESVTIQKYPESATGREFGALTATLQLAGTEATILSQKIKVEKINDIGSTLGQDLFWQKHDETFRSTGNIVSAIAGLSTNVSATPYANELKEGQIQDWMTGVHVQEVTYTAVATVTILDDSGKTIKIEKKALSCKIITTDATTKTYQKVASLIAGETVPVGLAESIYNSLNPLQYEGKITLTEEECGFLIVGADPSIGDFRASLGFTLNLTGGLPAWATMEALIQQIDEDVDSGITTISFGPPEQLSIQDLMEFLRANRGRAVAFSYQKRGTGESSSGENSIALSGPTPLVNTAGASGQTKLLVVTDDTRKIVLDPSQVSVDNKYKVFQVRSATECGFDVIRCRA